MVQGGRVRYLSGYFQDIFLSPLKTSLDHLPQAYQRELSLVVDVLHGELENITALKSSPEKKQARILKIILFGSFARGTWVADHVSGYKSDYDLLVIVSSKWLAENLDFRSDAFDRLMHHPDIGREVNFIVHTLTEVNDHLAKGQYFFSDIKKDGIALYEQKSSKPLASPANLSPTEAYEISRKYYDLWFPKIGGAISASRLILGDDNPNDAAFMLHQAVERAYACVLLTFTHYVPGTHSIKFLRSLAEQQDARLFAAWPRDKSLTNAAKHKAAYELLAEAYVKARYSEHFTVTDEQLTWLTTHAETLQTLVKEACETHLASMQTTPQ